MRILLLNYYVFSKKQHSITEISLLYLLQIEACASGTQGNGGKRLAKQASCDTCSNYVFDEEEDAYLCEVSFDEDEMAHFLLHPHFECPYYSYDDEYRIVRHQM